MSTGADIATAATTGPSPTQHHTYLFETKSLQRYIFETGRLYDMVAASALIDALCRGDNCLLERVSASMPETDRPRFSRRAGGALAAHFASSEALTAFRTRWTLALQMIAPGLEFVQASGAGASTATSAAQAREALGASHNAALPLLPVAGPLSERATRTGRAATGRSRKNDELIDIVTTGKQREAKRLFESDPSRPRHRVDPVAARLGVTLNDGALARWPLNLDRAESATLKEDADRVVFPYGSGPQYLGVIHADGNGLGQLVMALGAAAVDVPDADYVALMTAFSEGLDKATHDAVHRAASQVLVERASSDGILPARPFILGGDDLGIIVRADCAVEFTQAFLEAFEGSTQSMIAKLGKDFQTNLEGTTLPKRLTAAAGIAFIKPHQPFYRGYSLAESLCAHAKRATKACRTLDGAVPSALAFHRVTTSMIDDYAEVREREVIQARGAVLYELSVQPWYVGEYAAAGPQLEHLLALRDCYRAPSLSMSRLREVLEAAVSDPDRALVLYRRWRDVVSGRGPGLLAAFDEALGLILGGGAVQETFWQKQADEDRTVWRTPLSDVLALAALVRQDSAT